MTTSDSTSRTTDDIRLVDGPDHVLAARLQNELDEFNFNATGIRDARDFAAALHDEGGALIAGAQGGRGARPGGSSGCGCAKTRATAAWGGDC